MLNLSLIFCINNRDINIKCCWLVVGGWRTTVLSTRRVFFHTGGHRLKQPGHVVARENSTYIRTVRGGQWI